MGRCTECNGIAPSLAGDEIALGVEDKECTHECHRDQKEYSDNLKAGARFAKRMGNPRLANQMLKDAAGVESS